jgi:transcriptional regulator with GAF, ATPase, and Fis domain
MESAPDKDEFLKPLYNTMRVLLDERDYGELLAALLDAAISGVGAERGFLLVPDGDKFRATVARNFRNESLARAEQEVSRSIAKAVLDRGQALLIGDASGADPFRARPSVRGLSIRSVLCAPIISHSDVCALIYLENRDVPNFFTEQHRRLLDEICLLAAPRLRVAILVENARALAAEVVGASGATHGILTCDPAMAEVLNTIRQVASTDLPVLIQGETGTGKELVARAVYRSSRRAQNSFVVLNCAAIPPTLIGSELFGYVRGAFTGAASDRIGFLGAANRGTLFLDEIGDLPLELQPQLLRVLQSGEFTRLGSVHTETVDIRVVAATNRDLQAEVDAGRFRADLYYRLSTITLKVPPLRQRPDDLHLLAAHFIQRYAKRFAREVPRLSDEAQVLLSAYSFPGNIRELEGEMARLVALNVPGSLIPAEALSDRIRNQKAASSADHKALPPMSLEEMEKQLILSVLEYTRGNRLRACEVLGVSREGLRTKMQRLGITAKVPAPVVDTSASAH